MKNQQAIIKEEKLFYLKSAFLILGELCKFSLSSFEQIIHSLKKSIAISKSKLDAVIIIKKITKLLDFLNIKSCFLRSIIIYKLLKKYQHAPRLHIGIKKRKSLESHAWIEINNTSIDTSKGFEIFTTIE